VRDYWRGEDQQLGEFAYRLTGSSDLYEATGRRPSASINFVTAHDGFTLTDLVSYNDKHNEANGEENKDGESHNRSWNCGVEGPTDDPDVNALRLRQRRNFLATLFLSQGVPMLLAGDEIGRTQKGNNNAYCQDNETSWIDWEHVNDHLLEFTRSLTQLRKEHPVFRRRRWFQGRPIHGSEVSDIAWFLPDGSQMNEDDWHVSFAKSLGVFLNGDELRMLGPRGERVTDDSFYIIFNAHDAPMRFVMPEARWGKQWEVVLDTTNEPVARSRDNDESDLLGPGDVVEVRDRSCLLLRRLEPDH
jgi:glycogen operon protein